jgi:basic amino acid/polyamine antiporter, APA family
LLEFNQTATETRHQSRSPLFLVGVILMIGCMLLVGEVRTIWSFSAFAFLMHTALTFWVALQQTQSRLYPRWLDGIGLAACLGLAFSVEWNVWLVSLSLIALGLIWRGVMHWSNEEE